jgi:hypothetical protein
MSAKQEVGVDPRTQRREPQLFQAPGLSLRERLCDEVAQRLAAPLGAGAAKHVGRVAHRAFGEGPATLLERTLESLHVDLRGVDSKDVPPWLRARQRHLVRAEGLECLAQAGHVDDDRMLRTRRWSLPPQLVDQEVARDDLVRMQHQEREQRPLLHTTELDRPPVDHDLNWAEQPEVSAAR